MGDCDTQSQPLLTGKIFTILHLLDDQTAEWILTARNGGYKLVIKWRPQQQEDLPPKQQHKKSSKARTDRNRRRLQAFLERKKRLAETGNSEPSDAESVESLDISAEENGTTALNTDVIQPMETGETAQHLGEEKVLEIPTDPNPEIGSIPCLATPLPEDPACLTGAEGRPSTSIAGPEYHQQDKEKDDTNKTKIEKVTLDLPQSTYLFKVAGEDEFLLAYEHNLEPYTTIRKRKHKDLYTTTKRSHDHWLDVRDRKNFVFTEKRCRDVQTIAEKNNLVLKNIK